jgi:hypothetical protein
MKYVVITLFENKKLKQKIIIFTCPYCLDWLWGSANLLSNGYPGVKCQGCEDVHSPPSTAEVNGNMNLYIQTPICLYGIVIN